MNPIYVFCHMCHADVGQPCRWGCQEGEYHDRRVRFAERGGFTGCGSGSGIDTDHALAHGSKCTGHSGNDPGWQNICTVCGQNIQRLKDIPKLKGVAVNIPSTFNVIDRHGGFTAVVPTGTLWRPGNLLKRGTTGTLVSGSIQEPTFYQTNNNVVSADYKVPGYRYRVRVWWDRGSGERLA